MMVVRGNLILDQADVHGGIWLDKDAHCEITNCTINDGPARGVIEIAV